MEPDGFIQSARLLADGGGNPSQESLRRAVSTAYYALFHALCYAFADLFVGDSPDARASDEWHQAYRSLDHGLLARQCRHSDVNRYSRGLRFFAKTFEKLQTDRHKADYSPRDNYNQDETRVIISDAETAIAAFHAAPEGERRRFVAYAALRRRSG